MVAMELSQALHAASAMLESLGEILLDHVGGDAETIADILVAESVAVLKNDGSAAFRRQLGQHLTQPPCTHVRVDLAVKLRQLGQLLLDGKIVYVVARGTPPLNDGVFLHQIVSDRIEIQFR